jgi:hypothetical protein
MALANAQTPYFSCISIMVGSTPPIMQQVETTTGTIWRVTFAGITREHRQRWQAEIYYQQAMDAYNGMLK